MDIFHKLFLVARNESLHQAPLIPNYDGPRILDLGTGTGIWAIDMAELVCFLAGKEDMLTALHFSKYPTAEVPTAGLSLE